jgi:hypothetical protein
MAYQPQQAQQQQQQQPQQQQQQVPAQPAGPAQQTGKFRGETPDFFTGDRTKSEDFMQQFNVHWGLNDNHEVMMTPYLRAMYMLSLCKGPLVSQWAHDQVLDLRDKVARAHNPVDRMAEALWIDVRDAFVAAYSDTAKVENAFAMLLHLRMNRGDLDGYIATFKHLAREAGYDTTNSATINMFAHGLDKPLLDKVLRRDAQPSTLQEWIDAAKREVKKAQFRQALMEPTRQKYKWVQRPQPRHNGHYRHRNDEVVPMDVDPPTFTRVNRAYTEADKNRFQKEGRCYNCDQRGHMAKDCPQKKYQRQGQANFNFNKKPQFKRFNKPKRSDQSKPRQGFRKSNRKPPHKSGYFPTARVAQIEEIDSDYEYEPDDSFVASHAARTAKLSDDQKEEWLNELNEQGIHF